MNVDDRRMLLGLCLSMHTPLILWFLLLPCIAAWRLYPPDKTLVLPCPVALENTTGSVSWFRDGQRSLLNTSESSSLVIKDPWYTESGNYTCCYAFSNWTGNADCFSSYIVFADKTELPPNLLRDTLPQPGETPIFKGITYWQPAMLLSFRPVNFFKRTNFSCLYFIRTTTRIPKIEWFFLHSNSELSHNISTEELPCPSELLDGLHGIYEEDDFYGIRNRCFRSVLTLNYRALGQDGENRPHLHRTTATPRDVDNHHHRRANSRCSVAQHHLRHHCHNLRADGDEYHHLTMDGNSSRRLVTHGNLSLLLLHHHQHSSHQQRRFDAKLSPPRSHLCLERLTLSVTCESIVLKLATQCQGQQHTPVTPASTAYTVHRHPIIEGDYSALHAFVKICSETPQPRPHHQISPPT
ncbi:hypothetical protein SprV_0200557300 [Sparganum proliferum]